MYFFYQKWTLFLVAALGLTYSTFAQINLTFQVNMSHQITLGNFSKSTDWVEVAGSFNGWNGSGRFQDDDEDEIYELTIGGFSEGDRIEFKFRYNGQWDGREEFPGVGNNRTFTVGSEDAVLTYWYNNETPPDANLVADWNANYRTFYEQGIINFEDRSSGRIDSWQWTFEGGTPNQSTERNPTVQYKRLGKYPVKLTVKRGDQSDTEEVVDYVNVLERNTTDIPWWNESVFYEIFVRSFNDSDGDGIGDFQGLIDKLDYLNDGDPETTDDLGITGIWLMPIHEAGSYHGYDVIDYESVSAELGGMEDFKRFLAEAHQRGIKVIIDFVLNHNSSQSEWFKNAVSSPNSTYRNFYRWSDNNPGYSGPWGQRVWHERNGNYYYGLFWDGMPDLNYSEPKVKEEIFRAADFWLEDIGVDGFRLDAVKFIVEEGTKLEDTQGTFAFWKEFTSHIKATKPDAFSVGEAWTNSDNILNYVVDERIDYCFEFDLAGNILYSVNDGVAENLYGQMQKMYNIYPHLQYGTFLTNHDQNRLSNSVGGDVDKMKLAASIYLSLPGVPYIYYGEEIGMSGSKPDEFIRRPMQWNDEANAGFTTGTPWIAAGSNFRDYSVEEAQNDNNSILRTYQQLVQLRNEYLPLSIGSYEVVPTSNRQVFAFVRTYDNQSILVLHNTGTRSVDNLTLNMEYTSVSAGDWALLDLFEGEGFTRVSLENGTINLPVDLAGKGTKIFEFGQTVSSETVEKSANIKAYPNPVADILVVDNKQSTFNLVHFKIFDLHGRLVQRGQLNNDQQQAFISTATLPQGSYHLHLIDKYRVANIPFVKAY
ncbi:MAG: alpha-amylase family glycosyl hydrolase [Bacteroidota bacterium]